MHTRRQRKKLHKDMNVDLISVQHVPSVGRRSQNAMAADEISSLWRSICTRLKTIWLSNWIGKQVQKQGSTRGWWGIRVRRHTHKHTPSQLGTPSQRATHPLQMRCTARAALKTIICKTRERDDRVFARRARRRSRIKSPRPAHHIAPLLWRTEQERKPS